MVDRILRILSSFGLAVVLLALLFVVVLLGTFEQVDYGLYDVQKRYFEGFFLITNARIFGSPPIRIPLIGATPLLGLLTLNLLLGGILRMRKNGRTLGILITHLGVVLMIAAGLVKLTMSEDGHLQVYEGEWSTEYVSYYDWEVVVHPLTEQGELREHVIAHKDLVDLVEGRSASFRDPGLPFVLELSNFVPHCSPMPKGPMWEAASPVIEGWALRSFPPEKETERNIAGLVARVKDASGETRAEGLLWGYIASMPWTFEWEGQTWVVKLRHESYPMPFRLRLDDFRHERHPGMSMAKAFESDVTIFEGGEPQAVLISMNQPLRTGGLVVFQSGFGPQNAPPGARMFSDFSVVRNPSDHWPLYSCIVIGIGLLLAFVRKLAGYVRAQSPARATTRQTETGESVAQEAA